jgi:hypothetical protein
MKSTLKVTYERHFDGINPVLQIVQPLDLHSEEFIGQDDPKDDLLTDFLRSPLNAEKNWLFDIASCFNTANHSLTSIKPVALKDEFSIAVAIIQKQLYMTSRNDDATTESCVACITEMFDRLDVLKGEMLSNYVKSSVPKKSRYDGTIRHYFEMCLADGERMNAFNNTPIEKWDMEAKDAGEALDIAFDFGSSPQGYDYWDKIRNRVKTIPVDKKPYQVANVPNIENNKYIVG